MELTTILTISTLILVVIHFIISIFRRTPDFEHLIHQSQIQMRDQQNEFKNELRGDSNEQRRELTSNLRDMRLELDDRLVKYSHRQSEAVNGLKQQVQDLVSSNEDRFNKLSDGTAKALEKIRGEVSQRLETIRTENHQQLEKMRVTVDEKLHQTLEERLGRSFRIVSDHLEKVQKGLGEMQSLAAGVGDLKKVLSNVKTRGILGEIQLLNIIEEIMTPDQYELNISVTPGKDSRVEVAIKMPGKKNECEHLFLPIDSKFPLDKYQSLTDAYDLGCALQIAEKTKELKRAILVAAKDIQTKYIAPPHTTDFAIMFLPVEGLYAEISRQGDLLHDLRSKYQILVAGPNNLSAFLSSLQMGFRTLAIEKRSSEVWTMLSEIKTEFGKFGGALEKVQKKLSEANNAIDQVGVRRRVIERKLNKVEELPDDSLVVKRVL